MLIDSYEKAKNPICLGLDPVLEALPDKYLRYGIKGIEQYLIDFLYILNRNSLSPAAFKPNQGYYLRYDDPKNNKYLGTKTLAAVLQTLNELFPGIPIILDSKRGDIVRSSKNYADEAFDVWKADAVTVSPYMGTDSVSPFLDWNLGEYGVYVLNRTSNPGASDFQNLQLADGRKLYEAVSDQIIAWSQEKPGVGAVVGATSPAELSVISKKFAAHQIPLLIPGVGSQGGSFTEALNILKGNGYNLALARINSSSAITHPWVKGKKAAPQNWAGACMDAFETMCESFLEWQNEVE
ncbi:MAG TPA: orotidine-5'-phosphate decarboxylase [Candidatus Marinimicrobia bacterium]|nr:orotidine-5'-phosphate decarboxylase [Candidatus Neomarinimicrobiota bacterium]